MWSEWQAPLKWRPNQVRAEVCPEKSKRAAAHAIAARPPQGRHCEPPLHPFGCVKGVRRRGNLLFHKVRLPRCPFVPPPHVCASQKGRPGGEIPKGASQRACRMTDLVIRVTDLGKRYRIGQADVGHPALGGSPPAPVRPPTPSGPCAT